MNRLRFLVVLSGLLCIALIYAWYATPRQPRLRTTPEVVDEKTAVLSSPLKANDFVAPSPDMYREPQRNLFGALYPEVKKIKRIRTGPVVTARPKPLEPPDTRLKMVDPPRAAASIQPLNVLGHLVKGGKRTVFLSSSTGRIYLLQQGDPFARDLIVRNITDKNVTIGRKDSPQQVVLALGDKRSQRWPSLRVLSESRRETSRAKLVEQHGDDAPVKKKRAPARESVHMPNDEES
ncbi:hypothetical protein [uncultured Desulfuromonas sp.]|uniref:hypothetical protein n=1 Tax=uncultured Desulfuromonas sp. TaxID=181013 RepID=UPI002AAAE1FC|nr:hypothetical protein [uncultured Desulfuromonas sp.]